MSCEKDEISLDGDVAYTLLKSQEGIKGSGNNIIANFFVYIELELAKDSKNLLIVARNIRKDRRDPINIYFFTSSIEISNEMARQWIILDPKLEGYTGKVISSYSLSTKKTYYKYVPLSNSTETFEII